MRASLPTVIAAALALGACQSQLDKAKADYEFMKRNGATSAELCHASDAVVAAALEAKNTAEYQLATVTRNLDCNAVRLEKLR